MSIPRSHIQQIAADCQKLLRESDENLDSVAEELKEICELVRILSSGDLGPRVANADKYLMN